jgi:hypothetical protein
MFRKQHALMQSWRAGAPSPPGRRGRVKAIQSLPPAPAPGADGAAPSRASTNR